MVGRLFFKITFFLLTDHFDLPMTLKRNRALWLRRPPRGLCHTHTHRDIQPELLLVVGIHCVPPLVRPFAVDWAYNVKCLAISLSAPMVIVVGLKYAGCGQAGVSKDRSPVSKHCPPCESR